MMIIIIMMILLIVHDNNNNNNYFSITFILFPTVPHRTDLTTGTFKV